MPDETTPPGTGENDGTSDFINEIINQILADERYGETDLGAYTDFLYRILSERLSRPVPLTRPDEEGGGTTWLTPDDIEEMILGSLNEGDPNAGGGDQSVLDKIFGAGWADHFFDAWESYNKISGLGSGDPDNPNYFDNILSGDFENNMGAYGNQLLGGFAGMLPGMGNYFGQMMNLFGSSAFSPDNLDQYLAGIFGTQVGEGNPLQNNIQDIIRGLTEGVEGVDLSGIEGITNADDALNFLMQNGMPNQAGFFESVMPMLNQQGTAFGNSSRALNHLLSQGVPLQNAFFNQASSLMGQGQGYLDQLGLGLNHILQQGLPGQQDLYNTVLPGLLGNIGQYGEATQGLLQGQNPFLQGPLFDQLQGNLMGQLQGGGLTPDFVQAQRDLVLKPQQEQLMANMNAQGGGVADPNSPLFQELQRRQEGDFGAQLTSMGFQNLMNSQQQAQNLMGLGAQSGNQLLGTLGALGGQDISNAMNVFQGTTSAVQPFMEMAGNLGMSMGDQAMQFQNQPTQQVLNLIAQSSGLGGMLGQSANMNQSTMQDIVMNALIPLSMQSGQFGANFNQNQNMFAQQMKQQLLAQLIGQEQFGGQFAQGNIFGGMNAMNNLLGIMTNPLSAMYGGVGAANAGQQSIWGPVIGTAAGAGLGWLFDWLKN
jgi:hypothetical protein